MSENRKTIPKIFMPHPTIDAATDAHLLEAAPGRSQKPQPPKKPDEDLEDAVDQASYDSFPASDPPSFSPTRTGPDTGDRRSDEDRRPRKS